MKTSEFIKKEWLCLIILLVPFVVIIMFWDKFPEMVPMHWNFSGEIDDYSPKEFGLFAIPGLNIVMFVLFLLLPRIDPHKANYLLFSESYKTLRISILSILLYLFLIIALTSLGLTIDVGMYVIYGILILFMIMGNIMGKIRPNYFVGIRTPWTLNDKEVWRRTHRLAGPLWFHSCMLMIVLGFLLPFHIYGVVFWVVIGIITVVPIVYSYILSKRLPPAEEDVLVK